MEEGNPWYLGWGQYEEYDHPILRKHKTTIETLIQERVFTVKKSEKGFCVMECCDEYFSHDLTRSDCLELAALFEDLAKELEK